VLTCLPLPESEPEFFELLKIYFPCIFDMKVGGRGGCDWGGGGWGG
jgi:hypothetical protein